MKRRLLLLLVSLMGMSALPAQAAAPVLTHLTPSGGQQGTTGNVTALGTFDRWPVPVWCEHPGIQFKPLKDKGTLSVAISADVVPGAYLVRLYDEQGASALRPFLVGTLPETVEKEPNDDPKKPQTLAASSVVHGRLDRAGDVDGYALPLVKGQTLVAALDAHRVFGSPMDAVLQVLAPTGFVLEQNNDDWGLDPFLTLTAPATGTYVVRVFAFPSEPDSSIRFSGGENYHYRLTLTTGGYADHAFPLAVSRAKPVPVGLHGWNLPDAVRNRTIPATETLSHPSIANAVRVLLEPHPTVAEVEPNDALHPQSLSLPVTVSGRMETRGDQDAFEFPLKKGQKVNFVVEARELGSLLHPVLKLTDKDSKQISQIDEGSGRGGLRAVELAYTVAQDGVYRVVIRDLYGAGSFRHVYRMRATNAEPDYDLRVAANQYLVTPEKPLDIPVTITRRNGFAGEIELVTENLPPGVSAPPVKAAASASTATLRLIGTGNPASGPIRVVGRVAKQDGLDRIALAPGVGPTPSTPHLWLTLARPGTAAPATPPPPKKR